jgi:hypothetical protein
MLLDHSGTTPSILPLEGSLPRAKEKERAFGELWSSLVEKKEMGER